jgi:hypothetical protein
MKKHNVLVGFMERMEEFLVQLRHRVGWKDDMRNILHYNHKRSSSAAAPIRTKYHIPGEFLNLMNEQDYVTTEMDFHSSVRLLYLDQVPSLENLYMCNTHKPSTCTLNICAGFLLSIFSPFKFKHTVN